MKLTTTSTWPPDGWTYRDPKTGYFEPLPRTNNFAQVAQGILKSRQNNSGIYTPTERTIGAASRALEDFTCWRLARKGIFGQIVLEDGDEEKLTAAGVSLKKKAIKWLRDTRQDQQQATVKPVAGGGLLSRARQLVNGVATLKDWLGEGGESVEPARAEARAEVCASCPLNDTKTSIWSWFTGEAAKAVKEQLSTRFHLDLKTKSDAKLGVCTACGCQLQLKVWVKLGMILSHTDQATMERFHPNCWIKKEREKPARKLKGRVMTVQRRGAIGDVVMASGVMKRLSEVADVNFFTAPGMDVLVKGMDWLNSVEAGEWTATNANLDLSYEKLSDKERASNPIPTMFMKTALQWLEGKGLRLEQPFANLTPELVLEKEEMDEARERLEKLGAFRLPLVAVVPRSNSWPCRTVSHESWSRLAQNLSERATLLWTGTDQPPDGYLDLRHRDLRKLTATLKACDLAVGVDTGPMHLAAGVGTPLVHVTQSVAGIMTLPDQRDWIAFNPALDCIACHAWKCPFNEQKPPCQDIDAVALTELITKRLDRRGVSAVIATYRPDPARINRAIAHVLPQVNEVVIAMDGDTKPDGITTHEKIRFVQHFSRQRRGFGRTFNLGARNAHGRWLLSVNDDVFLATDAVQWMKAAMTSDPKVAVTGCLLRYPDGSIQHGGCFRGEFGYGHYDLRRREPSIKRLQELECVTFAAAMFSREAFFAIKGFDERYDCYWEDPDWCLRARQAGWKVMYEPRATGEHIESATTKNLDKANLVRDGADVFHSIWRSYFDLNRGCKGLGNFL